MDIKMTVKNTKPHFDDIDIDNILSDIRVSLETCQLTFGSKLEEFENQFSEYVGTSGAVAVNSGTSALEIPLRYFGVEGGEVIVPTNTFVATANAVIFAGGKPIFADMDSENLCMDFEDVKKKINEKTKGIIIVHMAGLIPPYMHELKDLCEEKNIFLIEDAAHAHGSKIDGLAAGSIGDVGCFSFFPTKPMTTGEGGMITTNDENLIDFAKQLRHHGQKNGLMTELGYNWRMSSVNAIIGIHQLKKLDGFIEYRNEVAKKYQELFESNNFDGVELIKKPSNVVHSYWKYPVIINRKYNATQLQKILKEKYGIETGTIYHPPVHLQPYYKKRYGYEDGMLPISEEFLQKELCLPMYVGMENEKIEYVVESVIKEFGE